MGTHLIKAWSSTQPNIALSSGEAGVVGVTRACAVTLGYKPLLADLGLQVPGRVWTDSSAAIGICKRQGLGKLRHLDTQMLWVQQRVRNNDLDLYYVPGEKNPADVFTKPNIPQTRMDSLLRCMGCGFSAGRPESAPELKREGGTNVFMVRRAGLARAANVTPTRLGTEVVKGPRSSPLKARLADLQGDDIMSSWEVHRLEGLLHQRGGSAIASMHCDQISAEEEPEAIEFEDITSLPHETEANGWRLSHSLPEGRVEHQEPPDPLVEMGTALGKAGNGKDAIHWPI